MLTTLCIESIGQQRHRLILLYRSVPVHFPYYEKAQDFENELHKEVGVSEMLFINVEILLK